MTPVTDITVIIISIMLTENINRLSFSFSSMCMCLCVYVCVRARAYTHAATRDINNTQCCVLIPLLILIDVRIILIIISTLPVFNAHLLFETSMVASIVVVLLTRPVYISLVNILLVIRVVVVVVVVVGMEAVC